MCTDATCESAQRIIVQIKMTIYLYELLKSALTEPMIASTPQTNIWTMKL